MINQRGFTMMEGLILLMMLAILSLIAMPFYVSAVKAESIKVAAGELAGIVSLARQEAVSRNSPVCLTQNGQRVRLSVTVLTPCDTLYRGSQSDSNGDIRLTNATMRITGPASISFNSFGATVTPILYRVYSIQDNSSINVRISVAGATKVGL